MSPLTPRTGQDVVLIHDWLTGMRGGEKCLEVLCDAWPDASLWTLIHRRGSVSQTIERLNPRTSFLQRLPGVTRYYRYLLPLMPLAVRAKQPEAQLVVSFSHCVAKGVRVPPGVPHVSYCFTPMRYAWHMRDSYFRGNSLKNRLIRTILTRLQKWDRETAHSVTHFVAISETIRERIRECYDRDSVVIYPPVDTDFYTPSPTAREEFYLVVSAFAPYKRIDLAVEACQRTGRRLVVIGTGQDAARLRSLAGPSVSFLGWQSDEAIRDHFRRCRALLFPGEEDFGIVPVEAMACGAPVIAYGRGGATETIRPLGGSAPTGVFFEEQKSDALIDALERFEAHAEDFQPRDGFTQAQRFSKARFTSELLGYLEQVRSGGTEGRSEPRRAA